MDITTETANGYGRALRPAVVCLARRGQKEKPTSVTRGLLFAPHAAPGRTESLF